MTAPHPSRSDELGVRVLTIRLAQEQDVVIARQRARQIAELLGFNRQDQVRIATAVSEIARNAHMYAGGGKVEFAVRFQSSAAHFQILISDRGKGIADLKAVLAGRYKSPTGMGLGLVGAQRLMDVFDVQSDTSGTAVLIAKRLPKESRIAGPVHVSELAAGLALLRPTGAYEELQLQNQDLFRALGELREREVELKRLNQELEETNRGVVALYAELDDRAASLRRADELKSRFLSHMSHEFRTPLNSILALAGLLEARTDGELTAEQATQVAYIRRAGEEVLEMVNDLLDLAKVEAGGTVVQTAEVSVSALFGALRGMLRPLLRGDAVSLVFVEPEPDLIVNSDEGKLSQILRNLISNALKFTERGEVRVSVELTDDALAFLVSDTGIGIPEADHGRIFEEFAQVEGPMQRRTKGTGLGLPLSRKLAVLLGGDLSVHSAPGAGSTFRLRLPASALAAPAVDPDRNDARDTRETLLVIDDDKVSRYLIHQMMRGTGFKVTEAENGAVGVERARFDRPRAILLDLSMPEMNGFEALEELRSHPETRTIPVIVHTSRTLGVSEIAELESRGATLLPKRNVSKRHLLDALQRAGAEVQLVSDKEG